MAIINSGLHGAIAYTTAICSTSSDGEIVRYRGISIDELVGRIPFDGVWTLLVDDAISSQLLADIQQSDLGATPAPTGNTLVDLQRLIAGLGAHWTLDGVFAGTRDQLRDDLARLTAALYLDLGGILRRARFPDARDVRIPDKVIRTGQTISERLVIAWKGEPYPAASETLDAALSTVAEHGSSASTFTARVVASSGADASACIAAALSAMGGLRHGGASGGVLDALHEITKNKLSAVAWVDRALNSGRRLPGVGHPTYQALDPRVEIMKNLASRLDAPLFEAAQAYENAAIARMAAKRPDRTVMPNVNMWLPVVLDGIGIGRRHVSALLGAARIAGWSAHILEQYESDAGILHPEDCYVGRDPRALPIDIS